MKEDNFIEEFDKLIKEKVKRSGKSLGSYYKKIINYCKQRIDGKKNKEKN